MAAVLCPPGCLCGRHKRKKCPPGCPCDRHTVRTSLALSSALASAWREGKYVNRPNGSALQIGQRRPGQGLHWRGGATGDLFAAFLCPAGYVREYWIRWGSGRNDHYKVDFAHPEAKVNIELDGPFHHTTPADDALRDSRLRALGWKIIRIQHD
jgi:hypothetical protein